MKLNFRNHRFHDKRGGESAFTMVEIALCLAIVGFALVAIIGVLPTGMNVQRDNRQQTIINQDAAVWMDAIRNGARGYDDLTNYVVAITNFWTIYRYDPTNGTVTLESGPGHNWYTPTSSGVTFPSVVGNSAPLTNAARIVGILSTPKFWPPSAPLFGGEFSSNYVVATVRAMSGSATEKAPQRDPDVLDLAFTYRMVMEVTPYVPAAGVTNMAALEQREILWNNSADVRMLFRWPVTPRDIGNGRQTYRQLFVGAWTNYFDFSGQPVYFLQSSIVHNR
jgi:hypothetical protein